MKSRAALLLAAVLALLAFGSYANSLSNGFVYDDKILLQNRLITDLHQIPAIFEKGIWPLLTGQKDSNYYRPLQFVMYMLIYHSLGPHPFGFHLVMVLLHVSNTLMVYFLSGRTLKNSGAAIAAGVLFAIHPTHTEAVNWIAVLPDQYITLSALVAIWLFSRQDGSPRGFQIAPHCAIYALAIFTKETGVTLLPLYAGFEWICLGRRLQDFRKNLTFYSCLLITFALYLIARYGALGALAPSQHRYHRLAAEEYVYSAVALIGQYAGKLFLPTHLNFFHIFEPARTVTLGVVLGLATIIVCVIAALRVPAFSYPLFWIAITLAPVLNLTGIGENVFAERYLYLPSVGFVWIAGSIWYWWFARNPRFALAAAAVIVTAGCVQVYLRNRDFRDEITLFEATLLESPKAVSIREDLAVDYFNAGNLNNALMHARLAVESQPDSPKYHRNLAIMLMSADPQSGLEEFRQALKLDPVDPQIHYNFGLALKQVGNAEAADNEFRIASQLQK